MLVHPRVILGVKFAGTHLHLGEVKCLAQEHNTMNLARTGTWTSHPESRVQTIKTPIRKVTFNWKPIQWLPGPGCIKILKITWDFLQPFPVLWGVFSHAYKDKSGENVLKSTGITKTLWKHSPERRELLQKISRNLKYFNATGSRVLQLPSY